MNALSYTAGGLAGKLRRLGARAFAVTPMTIALERSIVSFTFDDFPKSAATAGAQMLEARGWRGTFFAAGGYAGGANHLGAMYDAGDLMRLDRSGHEIACHTFAHMDAGANSARAVTDDCTRNRRFLETSGLDSPLRTFAFPYGEASPRAKRTLLGNYQALRGVRHGVNRTGADRGLLKAVPLDGGDAGLSRALAHVEDARGRPGWLIFYGHDVRENHSEWGCTSAFLEAVCEAVERAGLEVETMARALERIEAHA